MNLFVNLLLIRLAVFFALGIGSMIWYYRALNDVRRESLNRQGAGTFTQLEPRSG